MSQSCNATFSVCDVHGRRLPAIVSHFRHPCQMFAIRQWSTPEFVQWFRETAPYIHAFPWPHLCHRLWRRGGQPGQVCRPELRPESTGQHGRAHCARAWRPPAGKALLAARGLQTPLSWCLSSPTRIRWKWSNRRWASLAPTSKPGIVDGAKMPRILQWPAPIWSSVSRWQLSGGAADGRATAWIYSPPGLSGQIDTRAFTPGWMPANWAMRTVHWAIHPSGEILT